MCAAARAPAEEGTGDGPGPADGGTTTADGGATTATPAHSPEPKKPGRGGGAGRRLGGADPGADPGVDPGAEACAGEGGAAAAQDAAAGTRALPPPAALAEAEAGGLLQGEPSAGQEREGRPGRDPGDGHKPPADLVDQPAHEAEAHERARERPWRLGRRQAEARGQLRAAAAGAGAGTGAGGG